MKFVTPRQLWCEASERAHFGASFGAIRCIIRKTAVAARLLRPRGVQVDAAAQRISKVRPVISTGHSPPQRRGGIFQCGFTSPPMALNHRVKASHSAYLDYSHGCCRAPAIPYGILGQNALLYRKH